MTKSIIADNKPIKVSLNPGDTYYYCTCGKSKNQPFCDGSHKGTSFTPMAFTAEDKEAYLCRCKQTGNKPFCDGTHKAFSSEQAGKPAPEKIKTASA